MIRDDNGVFYDFVTLLLDNVKNIVGNSLTLLVMFYLVFGIENQYNSNFSSTN